MRKIFISVIVLLIYLPSSFAEIKYPFFLNVISEDKNLKKTIFNNVKSLTPNYSNLELKEMRDKGVYVELFIYAINHKNSNTSKDTVVLSIVHTNKIRIFQLTNEVFKDKSKSSEQIKKITADLLMRKGGLLSHMNIAAADNVEQIDIALNRFLKQLSLNIEGYYIY